MPDGMLPPRSLVELQNRLDADKNRWRISLGTLMLASNLFGLTIALCSWTGGAVVLLIVPLAFCAPLIVLSYILFDMLWQRFRKLFGGFRTLRQQAQHSSPFDV